MRIRQVWPLIFVLFVLINIYSYLRVSFKQKPFLSLVSEAELFLNRDMIFIVGAQSSGTSLMRLLLDVHPDINCGDETAIVHLFLRYIDANILNNIGLQKFFTDFGIRNETIEKATGLFVYYVMENNKKNMKIDTTHVKYLCNKGGI